MKSHFSIVLKGLIDIKSHYFRECLKKTLGSLKIGACMTCPTTFPNWRGASRILGSNRKVNGVEKLRGKSVNLNYEGNIFKSRSWVSQWKINGWLDFENEHMVLYVVLVCNR